MARILSNSINANFLAKFNVETLSQCAPEKLTIKVWDLYGTAPKEGDKVSAHGQYIAAVIICEDCNKSAELHRDQLKI